MFCPNEYVVLAAKLAVVQGYTVNEDTGVVVTPAGRCLVASVSESYKYPTIRLVVSGLPKRSYHIRVHRFAAFVFFGDVALEKGTHVRHLNGDTSDNSRGNLAIGTPRQNELDKPTDIRSRSAATARGSQPVESFNAILTNEIASEILKELNSNKVASGRVRRGVVKSLARRYGVSPSTISLIGKGKTWTR